jgi:hypothetical protein
MMAPPRKLGRISFINPTYQLTKEIQISLVSSAKSS